MMENNVDSDNVVQQQTELKGRHLGEYLKPPVEEKLKEGDFDDFEI